MLRRLRLYLGEDETTKSALVTLVVGFSLLVPASFGLLAAGAHPTVLYPWPSLTFVPVFALSGVGLLIPTLFFFVWNLGLFQGDEEVPKRTYGLLAVASVLNTFGLVGDGWQYGLKYQGARYTYLVSAINFVWVVLL